MPSQIVCLRRPRVKSSKYGRIRISMDITKTSWRTVVEWEGVSKGDRQPLIKRSSHKHITDGVYHNAQQTWWCLSVLTTRDNNIIHYYTMHTAAAAGARAWSSDWNEQQARCTEGVIFCAQQYGYRVAGKSCYRPFRNGLYIYVVFPWCKLQRTLQAHACRYQ